jgi:hypothetical protein
VFRGQGQGLGRDDLGGCEGHDDMNESEREHDTFVRSSWISIPVVPLWTATKASMIPTLALYEVEVLLGQICICYYICLFVLSCEEYSAYNLDGRFRDSQSPIPSLTPLTPSHPLQYIQHLPLLQPTSTYTPSSMPTFLHHGASPPFCPIISSKSPTCLLSLTSLLTCPESLSFIALIASILVGREPVPCRANPWEPERMSSLCVHPPSLMTGNCYWRGSEDDERRLRWRYTSVP